MNYIFQTITDIGLRRLYKFIIKRTLGKYLTKDIQLNQIELISRDGLIRVYSIEFDVKLLNEEILQSCKGSSNNPVSPISIVSCTVGTLEVFISYNQLLSENCKFIMDNVQLVLEPNSIKYKPSKSKSVEPIVHDQPNGTENIKSEEGKESLSSAYGLDLIANWIEIIVARLQVSVKNLKIILMPNQNHDRNDLVTHFQMNVESIDYFNSDPNLFKEQSSLDLSTKMVQNDKSDISKLISSKKVLKMKGVNLQFIDNQSNHNLPLTIIDFKDMITIFCKVGTNPLSTIDSLDIDITVPSFRIFLNKLKMNEIIKACEDYLSPKSTGPSPSSPIPDVDNVEESHRSYHSNPSALDILNAALESISDIEVGTSNFDYLQKEESQEASSTIQSDINYHDLISLMKKNRSQLYSSAHQKVSRLEASTLRSMPYVTEHEISHQSSDNDKDSDNLSVIRSDDDNGDHPNDSTIDTDQIDDDTDLDLFHDAIERNPISIMKVSKKVAGSSKRKASSVKLSESNLYHSAMLPTDSVLLSNKTPAIQSYPSRQDTGLNVQFRLYVISLDVCFSDDSETTHESAPSFFNELCIHSIDTVLTANLKLKPTLDDTKQIYVHVNLALTDVELREQASVPNEITTVESVHRTIISFHANSNQQSIFAAPHIDISVEYQNGNKKSNQLTCPILTVKTSLQPTIASVHLKSISKWIKFFSSLMFEVAQEESSTILSFDLHVPHIKILLHAEETVPMDFWKEIVEALDDFHRIDSQSIGHLLYWKEMFQPTSHSMNSSSNSFLASSATSALYNHVQHCNGGLCFDFESAVFKMHSNNQMDKSAMVQSFEMSSLTSSVFLAAIPIHITPSYQSSFSTPRVFYQAIILSAKENPTDSNYKVKLIKRLPDPMKKYFKSNRSESTQQKVSSVDSNDNEMYHFVDLATLPEATTINELDNKKPKNKRFGEILNRKLFRNDLNYDSKSSYLMHAKDNLSSSQEDNDDSLGPRPPYVEDKQIIELLAYQIEVDIREQDYNVILMVADAIFTDKYKDKIVASEKESEKDLITNVPICPPSPQSFGVVLFSKLATMAMSESIQPVLTTSSMDTIETKEMFCMCVSIRDPTIELLTAPNNIYLCLRADDLSLFEMTSSQHHQLKRQQFNFNQMRGSAARYGEDSHQIPFIHRALLSSKINTFDPKSKNPSSFGYESYSTLMGDNTKYGHAFEVKLLLTDASRSSSVKSKTVDFFIDFHDIMMNQDPKSTWLFKIAKLLTPQTARQMILKKGLSSSIVSDKQPHQLINKQSESFEMTKVNVRVRDCLVDYCNESNHSRCLVTIGLLTIATNVISNSNQFSLKFKVNGLEAHISDYLPSKTSSNDVNLHGVNHDSNFHLEDLERLELKNFLSNFSFVPLLSVDYLNNLILFKANELHDITLDITLGLCMITGCADSLTLFTASLKDWFTEFTEVCSKHSTNEKVTTNNASSTSRTSNINYSDKSIKRMVELLKNKNKIHSDNRHHRMNAAENVVTNEQVINQTVSSSEVKVLETDTATQSELNAPKLMEVNLQQSTQKVQLLKSKVQTQNTRIETHQRIEVTHSIESSNTTITQSHGNKVEMPSIPSHHNQTARSNAQVPEALQDEEVSSHGNIENVMMEDYYPSFDRVQIPIDFEHEALWSAQYDYDDGNSTIASLQSSSMHRAPPSIVHHQKLTPLHYTMERPNMDNRLIELKPFARVMTSENPLEDQQVVDNPSTLDREAKVVYETQDSSESPKFTPRNISSVMYTKVIENESDSRDPYYDEIEFQGENYNNGDDEDEDEEVDEPLRMMQSYKLSQSIRGLGNFSFFGRKDVNVVDDQEMKVLGRSTVSNSEILSQMSNCNEEQYDDQEVEEDEMLQAISDLLKSSVGNQNSEHISPMLTASDIQFLHNNPLNSQFLQMLSIQETDSVLGRSVNVAETLLEIETVPDVVDQESYQSEFESEEPSPMIETKGALTSLPSPVVRSDPVLISENTEDDEMPFLTEIQSSSELMLPQVVHETQLETEDERLHESKDAITVESKVESKIESKVESKDESKNLIDFDDPDPSEQKEEIELISEPKPQSAIQDSHVTSTPSNLITMMTVDRVSELVHEETVKITTEQSDLVHTNISSNETTKREEETLLIDFSGHIESTTTSNEPKSDDVPIDPTLSGRPTTSFLISNSESLTPEELHEMEDLDRAWEFHSDNSTGQSGGQLNQLSHLEVVEDHKSSWYFNPDIVEIIPNYIPLLSGDEDLDDERSVVEKMLFSKVLVKLKGSVKFRYFEGFELQYMQKKKKDQTSSKDNALKEGFDEESANKNRKSVRFQGYNKQQLVPHQRIKTETSSQSEKKSHLKRTKSEEVFVSRNEREMVDISANNLTFCVRMYDTKDLVMQSCEMLKKNSVKDTDPVSHLDVISDINDPPTNVLHEERNVNSSSSSNHGLISCEELTERLQFITRLPIQRIFLTAEDLLLSYGRMGEQRKKVIGSWISPMKPRNILQPMVQVVFVTYLEKDVKEAIDHDAISNYHKVFVTLLPLRCYLNSNFFHFMKMMQQSFSECQSKPAIVPPSRQESDRETASIATDPVDNYNAATEPLSQFTTSTSSHDQLTDEVVVKKKVKTSVRLIAIDKIDLKIDYQANMMNIGELQKGDYLQLLNIIPLDGLEVTLKRIWIRNAGTDNDWLNEILEIWVMDIYANQLLKVLSGTAPLRGLSNIGSDLQNLMLIPIRNYRKRSLLLKGLNHGASNLLRTITMETLTASQKITMLIANALTELATDTPSPSISNGNEPRHSETNPISGDKKQIQPKDLIEGLELGYLSVAREMAIAVDSVIAKPIRHFHQTGAGGYLKSVIRATPSGVIRPLAGVAEGLSFALLGIRNEFDPEAKYNDDDIWNVDINNQDGANSKGTTHTAMSSRSTSVKSSEKSHAKSTQSSKSKAKKSK